MTETVVAVHGLWMNGMEMTFLRRRLQDTYGYPCCQFSYRSVSRGLVHNMRRLKRLIDSQSADQVHVVAHSLGGVLALQTLRRFPDLKVERVVCLGSPLADSRPARRLFEQGWGRKITGRTLHDAIVDQPLGHWDGVAEVGSIAGTLSVGLGRIIAHLDHPNDGVVSAAEARLPGISEYVELHVNHVGLVMSSAVVEQVAHFLRTGRFV